MSPALTLTPGLYQPIVCILGLCISVYTFLWLIPSHPRASILRKVNF